MYRNKSEKFVYVKLIAIQLAFLPNYSSGTARAQDPQDLIISSYNIKFLDAEVGTQGSREARLESVIRILKADLIGLQEIDDREALESIFDPDVWDLVIDDDSGDDQDVAFAVRKETLEIRGLNSDLDADNDDFLFPSSSDNSPFPNRRDVLKLDLSVRANGIKFTAFVVHLKARHGGRATTDWRREAAARKLVTKLDQLYDGKRYVLLGDFNDTHTDTSLNILETGDPIGSIFCPAQNSLKSSPQDKQPLKMLNKKKAKTQTKKRYAAASGFSDVAAFV